MKFNRIEIPSPRQRIIDEAIEAYIEWREERAAVWNAYTLWEDAPVGDAALAFPAYRAALDREQRACEIYAELVGRLGRPVGTDSEPVAAPMPPAGEAVGP
jgi:hypothetical protein